MLIEFPDLAAAIKAREQYERRKQEAQTKRNGWWRK
jgi:hypothetical protein